MAELCASFPAFSKRILSHRTMHRLPFQCSRRWCHSDIETSRSRCLKRVGRLFMNRQMRSMAHWARSSTWMSRSEQSRHPLYPSIPNSHLTSSVPELPNGGCGSKEGLKKHLLNTRGAMLQEVAQQAQRKGNDRVQWCAVLVKSRNHRNSVADCTTPNDVCLRSSGG